MSGGSKKWRALGKPIFYFYELVITTENYNYCDLSWAKCTYMLICSLHWSWFYLIWRAGEIPHKLYEPTCIRAVSPIKVKICPPPAPACHLCNLICQYVTFYAIIYKAIRIMVLSKMFNSLPSETLYPSGNTSPNT